MGGCHSNSKRGAPHRQTFQVSAPSGPFTRPGFPRRLVVVRAPLPTPCQPATPPATLAALLAPGPGGAPSTRPQVELQQPRRPDRKVGRASRPWEPLFPGRHFGSLFTSRLGAPRQHGCHRRRLTAAPGPRPRPAEWAAAAAKPALQLAGPPAGARPHLPSGGGGDCWECWFLGKTCSGRSADKHSGRAAVNGDGAGSPPAGPAPPAGLIRSVRGAALGLPGPTPRPAGPRRSRGRPRAARGGTGRQGPAPHARP